MKINYQRREIATWFGGAALVAIVAGCGGGSSSNRPTASAGEIVFFSSAGLVRADLDGSNVFPLGVGTTVPVFSPEWFPGRREIAYTHLEVIPGGGVVSIRAVKRDGTGQRQVIPAPAQNPSISGDGRRLTYVSGADIFVADAGGSNRKKLTAGLDPCWSPDGKRIVYARYDDQRLPGAPDSPLENLNIYVMNADGSNQKRLTSTQSAEFEPQWSPDGRRIVYASIASPIAGLNTPAGIAVINSDGSGARQLTQNGGDASPKWTPDGARIVFSSSVDFIRRKLFSIGADGSNPTQLGTTPIETDDFDIR